MSWCELAVTLLFLVICNIGCKTCTPLTSNLTEGNNESLFALNKFENLQENNKKEVIHSGKLNVTENIVEYNNKEVLNIKDQLKDGDEKKNETTKIEVSDSARSNLTQVIVEANNKTIVITENGGNKNDTSQIEVISSTTSSYNLTQEIINSEGVNTEDSFKDGGTKNETVPWWKRRPYPLRQRARPCQCLDYKCGCCAGMELQRLNISQKGCLNFEYDPDEFSIEMEMLMNNRALIRRSVSGKNPPPMCIPIPSLVSFVPRVEFCARLFNIFTPGRNLHACLDWTTKINSSPILEVQFDCMRIGADGIAIVKPDAGGGLPEISGVGGDYGVSEGAESEDYDPLDPEYPEAGNKRPNKPLNSSTTVP